MAASTQEYPPEQVARALVEFTLRGTFPEEAVSSLTIGSEELAPSIEALAETKSKLQAEIHAINEETASDVHSWQANAKRVQDDILRSKALANDILKQADTPDVLGKRLHDIEAKADFLVRELNYNQQVQQALQGIKAVNQTLDQVERARDDRRILDALHLLEKSWTQLDEIPIGKSCRAIRLLDIRAFELKTDVHEVFDHVWNALVHVDIEHGSVSIRDRAEDEPMSLEDAVIGLKAYKEVDKRMHELWHDIDQAVIARRMDISRISLPAIRVSDGMLQTDGTADKTIKSLFKDLELVFRFLLEKLPAELVESISSIMMPDVTTRITTVWLDSAVPASLKEMDEFQEVISAAREFCNTLKSLRLTGFGELQEWVDSAPRVWLGKCRESALDTVRSKLAEGLGQSRQVEKVEKQMVSRMEGKDLTSKVAIADAEDHGWDEAWPDVEEEIEEPKPSKPSTGMTQPATGEDDGTDAWGWNDDNTHTDENPEEGHDETKDDEDDPTAAWGWGDDAQNEEPSETQPAASSEPAATQDQQATRELTLKETYYISSMPEPVLALIFAIVEDGAALTQEGYENTPVTAAAAGLFSLPTLALAMFRAVSPHYYAFDMGGSMYLYNDANYMAEKLVDFAAAWKERTDISTRARSMLRLDNDVKSMQSFATRAYSNEMSTQKIVLRDLLGGEQNLMQQDETESCIVSAVARVRSMAVTWENILARSVWYQAVGSLVDTISSKIITDVMELPAIGQDEAYDIAKMIATVTELDDLFLPSRFQQQGAGKHVEESDEVPTTAQYASTWLRLKYLSEVLQSNLRDLRYLWMESELSFYFTVDEVLELIRLSFEDNARTREVIREITHNPHPRQEGVPDAW
ncbi:hypothetical protein BR93DRAFT_977027 [Coniochaeta sp. PMI_546]|nr:hypothetical protein BR93DRAFT_977027 [Coniochaeta sp. PMI_546]